MRHDHVDTKAAPATRDDLRSHHCLTRRGFLKSLAAVGSSGSLTRSVAWAQGALTEQMQPNSRLLRIDVHHHMFPTALQEAWKAEKVDVPSAAMEWSLERSLAEMDRSGIVTAVLSIAHGDLRLPHLGRDERRRLARLINNFAAKARADHPGRFGLFAYTPMPDVDGALAEIEYALDVIKADGIGLSARYGERFLGDPDYRMVMDELERRKAVVYLHPDGISCCRPPKRAPPHAFERQNLNRALLSLLFSGTFTRTRNVSWIVSHYGIDVPLLDERAAELAKISLHNAAEVLPDGMDFELKRLNYETTDAASPSAFAPLMKFVPTSQILFGTGYPHASAIAHLDDMIKAGLAPNDLEAICRDNAMRLMRGLTGGRQG